MESRIKKAILLRINIFLLVLIYIGLFLELGITIYHKEYINSLFVISALVLLVYYENKIFTKIHIIWTKKSNITDSDNIFKIKNSDKLTIRIRAIKLNKEDFKDKEIETFYLPKHIFNPLILETDNEARVINLKEENNELFLLIQEEQQKNNSEK